MFSIACPRKLPILLTLSLFAAFATGSSGDDLSVGQIALPSPITREGVPDTIVEASAIQLCGDGELMLVAHDKDASLYLVNRHTGNLVGAPLTSPRFPKTTARGPKWEGMAHDVDGNYYVIGSHSGDTAEERQSRAYLLRFRLTSDVPPQIDDASIVRWNLDTSLVENLRSEGLSPEAVDLRKIEALAVRDHDGRRELMIGLRAPVDRARAFVADITACPDGAELKLAPFFSFAAAPREGLPSELTSMEYVDALGGTLILTASEDENNVFHGNSLYFVPDGEAQTAQLLTTFEVAMKAEGLNVIGVSESDERTTLDLLVSFDNDAHKTKIPSRLQHIELIRTKSGTANNKAR